MKKRSTLLKVMSIILIVLGSISLISSILSITMKSVIEQSYSTMGIALPTTLTYVLMFAGSLILIVSGIMGVAYKSRNSVLIMGIILAAYYIFDIAYAIVTTGFSAFSLIGLIWPLLYLWGWYQSN
jgi:hypothetical protein